MVVGWPSMCESLVPQNAYNTYTYHKKFPKQNLYWKSILFPLFRTWSWNLELEHWISCLSCLQMAYCQLLANGLLPDFSPSITTLAHCLTKLSFGSLLALLFYKVFSNTSTQKLAQGT